ncbi:MAG TPA: hypothetical protein DDY17_02060 [Syntrophaceae bacterium]|jgi:hypothetical protein|nr:hypothetical protein [Syntrophaceae bacterium]
MKRTLFMLMVIFILGIAAADAWAQNLTGTWSCNDGGTYYLHQRGNELWWLGESRDKGATWTNVFQGQIAGTQIKGNWADVPQGRIMGSGQMVLQIIKTAPFSPEVRLKAITKTGGFGGSEWKKVK